MIGYFLGKIYWRDSYVRFDPGIAGMYGHGNSKHLSSTSLISVRAFTGGIPVHKLNHLVDPIELGT
jgi:hypothetical protein